MTCDNCIHNEMCPHTYPTMLNCEGVDKQCTYFKDKSKLISVPYKPGDIAYWADPFYGYVQKKKYEHKRQIYEDLFYNRFGHSIFETEEEAQEALDAYKSVKNIHVPPTREL